LRFAAELSRTQTNARDPLSPEQRGNRRVDFGAGELTGFATYQDFGWMFASWLFVSLA
jgi:hypothetical protein